MLFHVGALREKQAPTVHTLILPLLAIYQMNCDTLSCAVAACLTGAMNLE